MGWNIQGTQPLASKSMLCVAWTDFLAQGVRKDGKTVFTLTFPSEIEHLFPCRLFPYHPYL